RIWREQLLQLRLFRVTRELAERYGGEVTRKELMQEIAVRLPMEDPETTVDTLVRWGRFGGLFVYSEDRGVLGAA
ncbi:MAG: AAA-associated domain-containing protein, partial [Vicinamibacteria bacterium]